MKTLQLTLLAVWLALPLAAQDPPPVTFTITIPADNAAKLEELRLAGEWKTIDEEGKSTNLYASQAEVVQGEFERLVMDTLLNRFPTAAIAQRKDAILALEKEIQDLKRGNLEVEK